ncbi:MAG: TraR/DksA family transcriptional regulator [Chitinophagaceae bacterium]|nr:TraR/DksA family transcriptional regulator [Chitinophagaceae bacterium]
MANKKPAPKKVAKPAPKKAAPKKAVKPAAKPAAKKAAPKKAVAPKKAAPKAKPAPKAAVVKPAPKKAVVVPAARKPEPAKPAPKAPVAKPAPAPPPVPQPVAKKSAEPEAKSLVSIKPAPKPIIKKEPPKPSKVVIPKTTIKTVVKYEPEFTKSVLDTPVNEQTGPTMRYSDADLAEFREIINKKLDAAKKELAYLQGLITRRDEGGDMDEARYMTMEDGSVSMEREQLSQMASRQITFIDHLEKAIMRIENKTYGVCRVTGKLIDKARLRAVPHATLSIEAKQMMNK